MISLSLGVVTRIGAMPRIGAQANNLKLVTQHEWGGEEGIAFAADGRGIALTSFVSQTKAFDSLRVPTLTGIMSECGVSP